MGMHAYRIINGLFSQMDVHSLCNNLKAAVVGHPSIYRTQLLPPLLLYIASYFFFSPHSTSHFLSTSPIHLSHIMAIKTSSSSLFLSFFFLYLLLSSIDFVASSAINNGLQAKIHDNVKVEKRSGSERRLMIGSMAPHCTYNECRGCRFKCQAEQVPVDTNDPMNSAYRYRCVCHI